jgi:ankyrin repeat protein
MSVLVFNKRELVVNDIFIEGVLFYDSIIEHGLRDSDRKNILLDYETIILIAKYKSLCIEDIYYSEKELIEFTNCFLNNRIRYKYLDTYPIKYLCKHNIINIMDNGEYIMALILEKGGELYFDNQEHFEKFLMSPSNVKYHTYDCHPDRRTNILYYLVYKKYDYLMDYIISYDIFNKIRKLPCGSKCHHEKYSYSLSILEYSCLFSREISSNKIIKTLLEHFPVIWEKDLLNKALIIIAARTNDTSTEETLKLLLEHPNIDVNYHIGNPGMTALVLAAIYSNTTSTEKSVKMLLDHPDIDVNLFGYFSTQAGIFGRGKQCALTFAAQYSNFSSSEKTVKMLLEHPKINVNIRSPVFIYSEPSGETPLMLALKEIKYTTPKTIKILLEHPSIDVKVENNKFETALIIATRYSCQEISYKYGMETMFEALKLLLEHPNININQQNTSGETPLHIVSQVCLKTEQTVKLLLEQPQIDINLQDKAGKTALMYAVPDLIISYRNDETTNKYRKELVISLLSRPELDINLQDVEGNTALIYSQRSSRNITNILLSHPNIDVNLQNKKGDTALMNIFNNEHYIDKIIEENSVIELLKNPNIDVNLQNKDGYSALMCLIKQKKSLNSNMYKLLLKHPNIDINIQDENGSTALMLAIKVFFEKRWYNEDKNNIISAILAHPNININLKDANGYTVLTWILETFCIVDDDTRVKNKYIYESLIKILCHPKIDINLKYPNGKTILEYIIFNSIKFSKIINLLKLFTKQKISHNMFYLHKKKDVNENITEKLKQYIIFERFNMINHRKYYRKNILKKIY